MRDSWAELYAQYVRRPCGLFPEPSAMSAAPGPWLMVLAGVLIGAAVRVKSGRLRSTPRLWAALFGGLSLLALSRSGLTPIVALGVALVATAFTLGIPGSR
jgi:hypothetical protein